MQRIGTHPDGHEFADMAEIKLSGSNGASRAMRTACRAIARADKRGERQRAMAEAYKDAAEA